MLTTCKTIYTDIAICGGGPAGAAAAIAAGRSGKRAILLEYRESLGGLATNGYINGIAGVVQGICKEWVDRLAAQGHAVVRPYIPVVEPEYGKVMLEQMVLQSGCRILYGAHVVDCIRDENKIKSVIVYCKSGKIEIKADVFIDCTGDADLAFAADVPCDVGNAEFCGLNSSNTMGFRLAYVNLQKYNESNAQWMKSPDFDPADAKRSSYIVWLQHKAMAAGDLHAILAPGLLIFPMPVGDPTCTDITLDATHTFDCHNDDVVDLTRSIISEHRNVIDFVEFLKKYVPGFENTVLESFAPLNGIRDSRRIVGEYILRDIDVGMAKKFDDGICQFPEFFNVHSAAPSDKVACRHIHYKEAVSPAFCRPSQDTLDYSMHPLVPPDPASWEVRTNPRDYCEIPFRSLIAKNVDNLLAAGKDFSAEYYALGSSHIIAPSMQMGQAAAIGASIYLDKKASALRELNGKEIREEMIRQGVKLDEAPDGMFKTRREFEGELFVSGGDMVKMRNSKGEIL